MVGPDSAYAGVKGDVSTYVKALLVLGVFACLDLRVAPVQGYPMCSAGLCRTHVLVLWMIRLL